MLGLTLSILCVIVIACLYALFFHIAVPAYWHGQKDAINVDDEHNWHIGLGRLAYKLGHAVESWRLERPNRQLKRIIDRREPNDGKDAYR